MATIHADRVKESTTTTGTGTYALSGAYPGFVTFNAAIGNGNTVNYCCTDGFNWEVGLGTYTSPNTLVRTTIYKSSNSNNAVNWSAGTKTIFATISAELITSVETRITTLENHDIVVLSGTSTSATPVALTTDGLVKSSTNLTVIPDNTTWGFVAHVSARNTANGDSAFFKIEGLIKRQTGVATTAIVGTPAITTVAADASASAWAVSVSVDTFWGCIDIDATGAAATTIHWSAELNAVKVA